MRSKLEDMLRQGQDSALLRLSLGTACLREDDPQAAIEHLRAALDHDPDYSAAWKELGRAHAARPDHAAAAEAWEQGIAAAERRGDKQAAKEMQVFLKRARRRRDEATGE